MRGETVLEIHPDDRARLTRLGLERFDALDQWASSDALSKASLDAWRFRDRLLLENEIFYRKRYDRPPAREQLATRLAGFPAMAAVEWHWLQSVRALGLAAPRPVACGWSRRGPREKRSLLLTAALPGTPLERLVEEQSDDPRVRDPLRRNRIAQAVTRLAKALHDAGLFHRDLYLSHVFLLEEETADVGVIDLQRMIAPRGRRRRWRIKDLAALHFSTPAWALSRAERLRAYRVYRGLGRGRLPAGDRRFLRAVERRASRMARHTRKHDL